MSLSTPVTVTVCSVFQLVVVKVREPWLPGSALVSTVATLVSPDVTVTVTVPVGAWPPA